MTSIFPRPFTIFTFLCICAITDFISVDASRRAFLERREVLGDLPVKNDLDMYLRSLEHAVEFAEQNRHYVDIHMCFGLFLVNVNLRAIIRKVNRRLPEYIQQRMSSLMASIGKTITYFQQMVDAIIETPDEEEIPEVYIAALFYKNEKTWTDHLQKFSSYLLSMTRFYSSKDLERIYYPWTEYVDKVFEFDTAVPTADQTIICMSKLVGVGETINFESNGEHCEPDVTQCTNMALNGTDYGYAVVHRLLYVIMGRFARGCSIDSKSADKKWIDSTCAIIYNEAQYIAEHGSRMPYLSSSQMSLCALEGHLQFLRRSWINHLLNYQSQFGCFGRWLNTPEFRKPYDGSDSPVWDIHRRVPILGAQCNTPTTGSAVSVLAAALRYIFEKDYT